MPHTPDRLLAERQEFLAVNSEEIGRLYALAQNALYQPDAVIDLRSSQVILGTVPHPGYIEAAGVRGEAAVLSALLYMGGQVLTPSPHNRVPVTHHERDLSSADASVGVNAIYTLGSYAMFALDAGSHGVRRSLALHRDQGNRATIDFTWRREPTTGFPSFDRLEREIGDNESLLEDVAVFVRGYPSVGPPDKRLRALSERHPAIAAAAGDIRRWHMNAREAEQAKRAGENVPPVFALAAFIAELEHALQ